MHSSLHLSNNQVRPPAAGFGLCPPLEKTKGPVMYCFNFQSAELLVAGRKPQPRARSPATPRWVPRLLTSLKVVATSTCYKGL